MLLRVRSFVVVSALLLLSVPSCGHASHVHEAPPAEEEIEPIGLTLFGERVLLFMEYPRLVAGEPARFLAHVSVLATGEPVRTGGVTLEIGATALTATAPTRDGLFIPEGALAEAGRRPAALVLSSEQASERLELGEFVVHGTSAEARAAAEADASPEDPGAVPFLLEQQWKLPLLLAQAAPARLTQRLVVPARVVPAEGASAVVAAPVAGRLLGPDGKGLARSGDLVAAGAPLAHVEPPLSAADAAQLRALQLEWNLKALEIEQAFAAATTQQRFARLESERIAKLRPDGLATQQQADAAQRDLALADAALDAARTARAAIGSVRAGPADAGPATLPEGLKFPVLAPIAGVVVGAGRVPGESVEAGATLFRVVDASRLWVEGRVSEFDAARIGRAPRAALSFPSAPGRRVEVGDSPGSRLILFGPEVDEVSRTVLLRYTLPEAGADLRPGLLADMEIAVATVDAAVAIPHAAVVMDGGRPTAWVMLGGESFARRELVLGVRDGEFVEVRSGVEAGERVVTRGASTLRLAALSPASLGAGHQH